VKVTHPAHFRQSAKILKIRDKNSIPFAVCSSHAPSFDESTGIKLCRRLQTNSLEQALCVEHEFRFHFISSTGSLVAVNQNGTSKHLLMRKKEENNNERVKKVGVEGFKN
jgi:hypothetical protein